MRLYDFENDTYQCGNCGCIVKYKLVLDECLVELKGYILATGRYDKTACAIRG